MFCTAPSTGIVDNSTGWRFAGHRVQAGQGETARALARKRAARQFFEGSGRGCPARSAAFELVEDLRDVFHRPAATRWRVAGSARPIAGSDRRRLAALTVLLLLPTLAAFLQ